MLKMPVSKSNRQFKRKKNASETLESVKLRQQCRTFPWAQRPATASLRAYDDSHSPSSGT